MKKIMFNDKYCLTQAVLNGTKTMTRRVERLNPYAHILDETWNVEGGLNDKGRWIFTLYNKNGDIVGDIIPRYNIGEVVAIAQSYKNIASNRDEAETVLDLYKIGNSLLTMDEMGAGWNNKMFVRADLMPHHIRITDIKVERLQDISDDECLKEGLRLSGNGRFYFQQMIASDHIINKYFDTPRDAFAYLIDKIIDKGTWESNPWVVAYSFELVDKI